MSKSHVFSAVTDRHVPLFRLLSQLIFCLLSLVWLEAEASTPQYLWSHFAGSVGGPGAIDATGSAARFYYPNGVAVDTARNVYVADTSNHTVRKITPAGVTTTLAGAADTPGSADGTGSAARFNYPAGVAVDTAGNVYVADTSNGTIRKITSAGVVSTFAGTAGSTGSANGTGPAAKFNFPNGVAVDSAGNIYVADSGNDTIRKITSSGVVSTLAGTAGSYGSADNTGPAAQFNDPAGVAVDSAGNVYVADSGNNTIRKITPAGVVTTFAGTAGVYGTADGTGPAAGFYGPTSVTVDGVGNIYVVDTGNNTARKITAAGVVTTLAGTAGGIGSADGTGPAAQFDGPGGVAVGSSGNVYVADTFNSTVRQITPAGVTTTLAGSAPVIGSADGTGTAASFYYPEGVALDSAGNLYVADAGNQIIRKITAAGAVTTLAGTAGNDGSADGTGPAASFYFPEGVAADSAGNVYVADTVNSTIRKITPAGVVTTLAGIAGTYGSADGPGATATFYYPSSLVVDGSGNIYVADSGNSTVRKITPGKVVSTLAGTAGNPGSADGTGPAAQFYYPYGVALDSAGTVYVADTYNSTIRKITPAGLVTTLAGTARQVGTADGAGSAAQFDFPEDVAVDETGNVYVTDTINSTIRKITPAGVVSTLAGAAGISGSIDGVGSAAQFDDPLGIAVDTAGNIYVADSFSSSIRKGSLIVAATPTITWPQPAAITQGTSLSAAQLNATATMGGAAVPGTFVYTPSAGTVLAAGANQTLSVTFTPTDLVMFTTANAVTTVTVNSAVVSAASPATNSSGGGAPSLWFYGALAALAARRFLRKRG